MSFNNSLLTLPSECSNYRLLNDSCKDNLKPGWHRFGGEAGNQMADTCVKMCHCGAWHPGWLTGGHPSVEDGAVVRKVCFVGSLGCCESSVYISVRNCSGFYVYNLTFIPSFLCSYGYCASSRFEEPTTSGKRCSQLIFHLITFPRNFFCENIRIKYYFSLSVASFMFKCTLRMKIIRRSFSRIFL